jgi:hypothetical protein
MVLTGSFVLSPAIGRFVTVAVAMRSIVDNLMPASRHQDHTTSPSASQRIRLVHCPRPSLPAPNVREDRETPLVRSAGCAEDATDLRSGAMRHACGALARRANHLQIG